MKKGVVYNEFYLNFGAFYDDLDNSFENYRRQLELVQKHCNAAKYLLPTLSA